MIENDTWYKCTVCGREGTVGRCCGDETRIPLNELAEIEQSKINTDKELFREVKGDYYSPSLHVTINGLIGINVGGSVHVMSLREWHLVCTLNNTIGIEGLYNEIHEECPLEDEEKPTSDNSDYRK